MEPAADASLVLRSETSRNELGEVGDPVVTSKPASAPTVRRTHQTDRTASLLQLSAALLWIPQAALLAMAVGGIVAGNGWRSVIWIALAVTAIGILRAVLDAAGIRLAFIVARKTLSDLRQRAITALARRSPLDISRPASGLAANVVAEQADAVLPYLARFGPARFKATAVPIAILALILPLSWVAALVLLIAAPLIPLFMALIGYRAKATSEKQLVEMGSMNAFLLDRLRGLTTIRLFDAVDATAKRLRANAESLRERTMAVLRVAFLSSAVLELFSALGVAMVAVYIGFHYLGQLEFGTWSGRLTLSEGLFILLLSPAFFEPLRELSAVWHDKAAGQAALASLRELAEDSVPIIGSEEIDAIGGVVPDRGAAVSIKAVSFRHAKSETSVLDGIDLDVQPGERVAILGPSGSGKTTLLALIAGLAPCESGHIVVAGQTLSDDTAQRLRARMIWIGQKPHIFAGSLLDNISLGRPEVDAARSRAALERAALRDVAGSRADVQLGEGGSGLSGGELLRLSLARAAAGLNKDLILADEPTAHLDIATADEIAAGLLEIARGKTLIVATHDPVLAARMDRIVSLAPRPAQEAA